MNCLSLHMLEDLNVVLKGNHLQWRENCTLNVMIRSSYNDSHGNSSIHLCASPIKESGKNLNLTSSWDIFLKDNSLQTRMNIFICSWVSSWEKLPNISVNCKRCNIVLMICSTALLPKEVYQTSPIWTIRLGSLKLWSLTWLRFLMSSLWPTCLQLL